MIQQLAYTSDSSAYRKQADDLFAALQGGDSDARWQFKWLHPRFRGQPVTAVDAATLRPDDARLVIAREYAFDTWADLVAFTEAVRQDGPIARFEAAVEAVVAGDTVSLQSLLTQNPELVRARSTRRHHATLLHYIGANGVEGGRQRTPANAVDIAKLLLDAGAEVDALADMYENKCTTMSLLVSSCHPANAGLQVALAETLLDYGAAVDNSGTNSHSAVLTALQFGYLDTARALARRGPETTSLVVAAGLGDLGLATRLLPEADAVHRHQALALAAQHGHADVVRLLLDAGEDPNRFNPEGFHSHSTPLHQAAMSGHAEVVRLLVEHGAKLDIRDSIYNGTPLRWADHGKHPEIVEYLRDKQSAEF